jgi:glycosyltransferase involved in cell wall biosynthesis
MLHYPDWSCAPFTRWALRYTDRVVCVSGWVRDYIARAVPRLRAPLTVVRNGVDLSRFTPAPGPDTGPLRFAIGCRLEPRKQVHLAIDALAAVPGVLLDIAGDGSERPRLEALARERGVADRVRFLGFLPDVRPVLLGADVALSCSRDEGLPLAVLEAMALGRTVIATPVGGVPEVVREGVEGLLVEQSAPAIAGAMRALAGDRARAQALGRAARTRVEQAFSLESMCRGYRDEYAAVLGASAAGSGAATG